MENAIYKWMITRGSPRKPPNFMADFNGASWATGRSCPLGAATLALAELLSALLRCSAADGSRWPMGEPLEPKDSTVGWLMMKTWSYRA